MTSLRRILRRESSAELQAALPATLHPVLRRVYGARAIAGPDELALRLDQLLPVSSLDGAEIAADLLASAHRTRRRRADRRRLRRRRRDQHRADDAAAHGARLRAAGLPRARSLPLRLRPHAGDRARRGRAQARPDRHRRQRHLVARRRRGGAASRHRRARDRSSPAGTRVAGRRLHREPERTRQPLRVEVAGRRGRRVLRDGGADA